jgi:hypothetical protein
MSSSRSKLLAATCTRVRASTAKTKRCTRWVSNLPGNRPPTDTQMKSLKELTRETVARAAQRQQETNAKQWKPRPAKTAQEQHNLSNELRRLLDKPHVSSDKLAFFGAPIFDIASEEDEASYLRPAPGGFVELRRSAALTVPERLA